MTSSTPASEEGLRRRYRGLKFSESDISDLTERLKTLNVTLEIGDEKISRLCQALTNYGCITYESCEGHAQQLPVIWFYPNSSENLMHISHILNKASYAKNFPWHIVVAGNPNASIQLSYRLEPSHTGIIKLADDYEKLMQDLDIIAVSILDYFAGVVAEETDRNVPLYKRAGRKLASFFKIYI